MATHILSTTPQTVHWGHFDAQLPPVLTVQSGDTVTIETISGEPDNMPDAEADYHILPEHIEIHKHCVADCGPHIMTGPVAIEGAEPGDVLEVRILDVSVRQDWGWNVVEPLLGSLPKEFPERRLMHIGIDVEAGVCHLPWGKSLRLAPFFGVMGVAPPKNYGRTSSIQPREFGGNMDNKELIAGATLYLPIWNEGALFSVGDGHGLQGDGEVCLTALETALSGTFELIVRKDMSLKMPRAENPENYITMAFDPDLDDAATSALLDMIDLIVEVRGLARGDAYTLCSLAADLRVTQLVDGNKGIHVVLAKSAL